MNNEIEHQKEAIVIGFLYINEDGAVVSTEANQCVVTYKDGMRKLVPMESLEGVTIMGRSQITTQCMEHFLKNGVPVCYFSKGGTYFGRLQSTGHVNTARQRKQCELYDTEFAVRLAQKILKAKIRNQSVLLRRYEKSKNLELREEQKMLRICKEKIDGCTRVEEMIGFEGQAAKYYFRGLSQCIEKEFYFEGRNRRPPQDPFNSMLSLGYSILMNEVYCKIEMKGLNPYFGFIHRDAEKHPTLASDMMEEWRAVVVDATVMSLINGHEIHIDKFNFSEDDGACYLSKEALKIFLNKLERKFQTDIRYLPELTYPVSFRRAILLQMNKLAKAIEKEDAEEYEPIQIR